MKRQSINNGPSRPRPTFDDMQTEKKQIIGPPSPPQIPKFTPASERAAVYRMMLDDLARRMAEESRQALEDEA